MSGFLKFNVGWKLFSTYVLIILIGTFVLWTSMTALIPASFSRHLSPMMNEDGMMMGMGRMIRGGEGSELFTNVRNAVNEALSRSALAAISAAAVISFFVSRRIVKPLKEMTHATEIFAQGKYDQRIDVDYDDNADELSQLAISFNRMAEELSHTEDMRRELIGDVTHELRTPLTAIKGTMEALEDGVLPPTAETFQSVHQEADRLERLVDDLQELSRIESGAIKLTKESLHIKDTVLSVTERLRPQFEEKTVTLLVEVPEAIHALRYDRDRIAQVLINLIGNGLQYTPAGGSVSVKVEDRDNLVEFSIRDSGVGIPNKDLATIFTRFYRVDKSRSRAGGGSGIGLTIAKHLVEIHGGRIWAESDGAGKGSRFNFTLPKGR